MRLSSASDGGTQMGAWGAAITGEAQVGAWGAAVTEGEWPPHQTRFERVRARLASVGIPVTPGTASRSPRGPCA